MSQKRPVQPYGLVAIPTPTANELDLLKPLDQLLPATRDELQKLWLTLQSETDEHIDSPTYKEVMITLKLIDHALTTSSHDALGGLDHSQLLFIIGYLYGQQTRQPPQDYWEDHEILVQALVQRQAQARAGKKGAHFTDEQRELFRQAWALWRQEGEPGLKREFDEAMAERFFISIKRAEQERLYLQKSLGSSS